MLSAAPMFQVLLSGAAKSIFLEDLAAAILLKGPETMPPFTGLLENLPLVLESCNICDPKKGWQSSLQAKNILHCLVIKHSSDCSEQDYIDYFMVNDTKARHREMLSQM